MNGIWERVDNDPYVDTVHLNQEGNHITATFEPTGYCYENPFNRESGISYIYGKLDFSGELTGNIIQGKKLECLIEERTTNLSDMKLTVTDGGRTLDGYANVGHQQQPLRYIFDTTLVNPPSIEVSTDKPNYNLYENVEVSGRIGNIGTVSEVFIQIYEPGGKQVFSKSVPISSDGSFTNSFDFRNIDINGTYTAFAIYPNATGKTSADFRYGLSTVGFNTGNMAIATGTAAAVGLGGILLYKQGTIRRIIDSHRNVGEKGQGPSIPVMYVGIECGLENFESPKKQSTSHNGIGAQEIIKLEQGFSKAVDDILKNRRVIKNVQKDIDFVKWCKEAKENPGKIISKVSDDVINKFLSGVSPYFRDLILTEINVESDISITRDRHKKIRKSMQFNLVPIEPYIEFVLYINTQRVSSTKFIFTVETRLEVKNLAVTMAKSDTNVKNISKEEKPEENYDKKISIESLIIEIAIEFSRLKIGPIEKEIAPPIIIGTKKIELKKFGSSPC